MSLFTVLFKVIPYLVPFIKEMLIGKKTWRQAFRDNRGKTILALVVILSVCFNVVLTARVGTLAFHYLELSHAKEELEKKYHNTDTNKAPIEGSAKHPISNGTEIAAEVKKEDAPDRATKRNTVVKPDSHLSDEVTAEFERIRQREAAEH